MKARRPNRSRGHRSPLDKLPVTVIKELRARLESAETLHSIGEWLRNEHSCPTNRTSLSDWRNRHKRAAEKAKATGETALRFETPLEIVLRIDRAGRISASVRLLKGRAAK